MTWTAAARAKSSVTSHRIVVCFCGGCGAQLERPYNRAAHAKCDACKREVTRACNRRRDWRQRRDVLADPKRGTVREQMKPHLVVVSDPGPHPLLPGLPLSGDERKAMLSLGCFNEGTVVRNTRSGRRYVVAGAAGTAQTLEAV